MNHGMHEEMLVSTRNAQNNRWKLSKEEFKRPQRQQYINMKRKERDGNKQNNVHVARKNKNTGKKLEVNTNDDKLNITSSH